MADTADMLERIFEVIDRFPFAPSVAELADVPELNIAGGKPEYPLIQAALDRLVASHRLHCYGTGYQRVYYTNPIQLI